MAGIEEGRTVREMAIPLRAEMLGIIAGIARDDATPPQARADAANKVLNRSDGTPAASLDMTSAGGPLTVVLRRFVEDVPEPDA